MTAPRQSPRRPPGRRTAPPPRGPGRELRRLPVLVVLAGCIAVAIALAVSGGSTAAPGTTPAGSPIAAALPTVPEPTAASATWYCAEGTGSPGGRADETIWIANVGDVDARADVTVMPGGTQKPASRRVTVRKGGQVRLPVSSVLEAPEQPDEAGNLVGSGVVVEVFGGRAIVEHEIEAQDDVAVGPCARSAGRDWYFAAGTTERGADQYAALFNPFADDAIIDVTFATDAGHVAPADLQSLVVPRRSRLTVPIGNFVRRQAQVGTHVHVRSGRVVAEQSLAFTTDNETRHGITLSLGAPSPASSWTIPGVLPEDGASHAVLVANFGTNSTEVEVAPRFEGQSGVSGSTTPVGGQSAVVVDLSPLGASGSPFGFTVRTTRPGPVVAEELASWTSPSPGTGAATALGAPVAARGWAFAVGRITPESGCTVSVVNPGRSPTTVRLVTTGSGGADGSTGANELPVPAGKEVTFELATLGVAPDQVVSVRADAPVIALRRILGPSTASLALGVADPEAG